MSRIQIIEEILDGMQTVRRKMAQHKPKDSHMTTSEWMVIKCLADGSKTVKEVAANLDSTSSAATQLIEGLVQEGLVTREQDLKDRRIVRISLLPESQVRLSSYKKQLLTNFTIIFDALSDTELEQFNELYRKIAKKESVKESLT